MKELEECRLCPHECKVNRLEGQKGRCRCDDKVRIALASVHNYEEPCISGENGSGTIFFTNCNLSCVYCQNYEISQQGKGVDITINQLAEIFLLQQEKNVNNINLVTPTTYVPQIVEAIKVAKDNGLNIPIIYNSNGYENVETLKLLEGYIDIYLPDLKYYSDELSKKYSKVDRYFENAVNAIKEMQRQVGNPVFDENGIIKKGMIIRHLVLPNHILNSKKILKYIKDNFSQDTYVSVMAQYFPTYKANEYEEINRKLTKAEYKEIENYLYLLDLKNGYIQELGDHEEEYVPDFNLTEQDISNLKGLESKMEEIYVIDRIEEDIAVCENRNDESMIEIELSKLPEGSKEGSVIKFINGQYEIDYEEQQEIEKRIAQKMEDLWN